MPYGPRYRERFNAPSPSNILLGTIDRLRGPLWARDPGLPGTPWTLPIPINTGPYPATATYERCWDSTNPGPPYLTGQAFTKTMAVLPYHEIKGQGTYYGDTSQEEYQRYVGGFGTPDFFWDDLLPGDYSGLGTDQSNSSLFPDLGALGSLAYDKLRPQLHKADLGVALGEIRDLPTMLKTTARGFHDIWRTLGGNARSEFMSPKNVADHFVNSQFGWVPFLSDISKLQELYQNSGIYMDRVSADNGKWVKRKRVDKVIESETVLGTYGGGINMISPAGLLEVFTSSPSYRSIIRFNTYVWYEGTFKYYRPEFEGSKHWRNSDAGHWSRLATLSGLRINPSVLWKITPWSWLIDWFTNVGSVIQRATDWAQDGIVSQYMYLMHHHVRTAVLECTLPFRSGPQVLEWSRICDIKRRRGASSPFGFDLSGSDLTGRQLAILGALGISRRLVGT